MSNDTEQSPTEFTKAALDRYRRRWRDTKTWGGRGAMKSVADARLSVKALRRWLRYFGPNSPLGPGMGGMLSVLLTVLVALIIGPIITKAAIWWWSLWLGR